MKKAIAVLLVCSFASLAGYAGQRVANAYKATKLTTRSVLVSCQDEREPQVSHLDASATAIVVTCR